jgi:hypothetical protein
MIEEFTMEVGRKFSFFERPDLTLTIIPGSGLLGYQKRQV